MRLDNLTFVTLDGIYGGDLNAESSRTFIPNNRYLEKLSLDCIILEGGLSRAPVVLSDLKSFSVY